MSNYEQSLLEQLAAAQALADKLNQESASLRRELARTKDELTSTQDSLNIAVAFIDATTRLFPAAEAELLAAEEAAGKDPMTQLPNRREFLRSLHLLTDTHIRYNTHPNYRPFAVLMIDLDHFKSINDTHGHAVGDMVLCAVADQMRNAFKRDDDLLSRFGGEEMVVAFLCPVGDNVGVTEKRAERLRTAIEKNCKIWRSASGEFSVGPEGKNSDDLWMQDVTASIGAAFFTPAEIAAPQNAGSLINAALSLADDAMYKAKGKGEPEGTGRNRVYLHVNSNIVPSSISPNRDGAGAPRGKGQETKIVAPPASLVH